MRLAFRLALLIIGIFVVALAAITWEQEGRLETRFGEVCSGQIEVLLSALDESATLAFRSGGADGLDRYLERLDERQDEFAIHRVRLDALERDPLFSHLPPEQRERAKAGERVVFVDHGASPPFVVAFDRLSVGKESNAPLGVAMSSSLKGESSFVSRSLRSFLIPTGLTILVGLAAAVILGARLISNPLDRIVDKARLVGRGDFTVRFQDESHSSSEIAMLSAELDSMVQKLDELRERAENEAAARVAVLDRMRHTDRLATVGTLAAGIAHELGTPLLIVAGRAKRIAGSSSVTEKVREEAESIREQCERMRLIVEQLLTFARKPGGSPDAISLGEVARRVTAWLAPLAKKKEARLELTTGDAEVRCVAHMGLVEQALTNVTLNAIQAVGVGGTVRVAAREERRPAPDKGPSTAHSRWAVLEVSDDGSGIATELQSKIFDPFFTTKSVGEGTGLGLAITHEIVQEHGGFIVMDSHTAGAPSQSGEHGTTMQLFFQAEAS
ncbi:Sensor protein of zinc sigma-54-dependent two-component system [Minicystis rosea]|nr:Sensor protein of zinc sigma-54-dependent two-component system [Minicystis rosea]